MADIFFGIGSNVDAEHHAALALRALAKRFDAIDVSRVYRNPAVGFDGADFLNFVVAARCAWTPEQVIEIAREIERDAGRARTEQRWGPRTLDIDLLLYGTLVDPLLHIPRSDVLRQAFVLCPLAELAPALRHPVTGVYLGDAWQAHPDRARDWTRAGRVMSTLLARDRDDVVQRNSMTVWD